MAAESNNRLLDSSDSFNDRVELEGLESFFEDDHDELFSKGLSIKQAVYYYGDTRRSLKARILDGQIPAIRLPEAYGRKWRVFPDGVPSELESLIPAKQKDRQTQNSPEAPEAEAAPASSSKPALSKAKKKTRKQSSAKVAAEANPVTEEPAASTVTDEAAASSGAELTVSTAAAEAVLNAVKAARPETLPDPANNLDFSVPGIDRPGQLILKAAGFLVEEEYSNSDAIFAGRLLKDSEDFSPVDHVVKSLDQNDQIFAPPVYLEPSSALLSAAPLVSPEKAAPAPEFGRAFTFASCSVNLAFSLPQNPETSSLLPLTAQILRLEAASGESHSISITQLPGLPSAWQRKPAQEEQSTEQLPSNESADSSASQLDLLQKIFQLEKQIIDTDYRNSYLEARLTGLEDQVKFITTSHYSKRSFNKFLFIVPALALLMAVLALRGTALGF